jgi:hypothetical protein
MIHSYSFCCSVEVMDSYKHVFVMWLKAGRGGNREQLQDDKELL